MHQIKGLSVTIFLQKRGSFGNRSKKLGHWVWNYTKSGHFNILEKNSAATFSKFDDFTRKFRSKRKNKGSLSVKLCAPYACVTARSPSHHSQLEIFYNAMCLLVFQCAEEILTLNFANMLLISLDHVTYQGLNMWPAPTKPGTRVIWDIFNF